jgi:ubiquinone/menaquinone biosynthesis C-methylase UbiE
MLTEQDPRPSVSPNHEIMTFWQDVMADKYWRYRAILVGATARHARRVFAMQEEPSGARVLDVGCGFGETTLDWARMVGERGRAVGIDPCEAFLEVARADAYAAAITNASFRAGDAQTASLTGFDRVFSAFGVMFFAQPVAALRNLRAALRPEGRMQLLVWNTRAENPWLTLAIEACEAVLPSRQENGATCGPGPFSMSDPEALAAMLRAAGLNRVELQRLQEDTLVGTDIEQAIDFQLALGPAGERMRIAGALGTPAEDRIRELLRQRFEDYRRDGGVWMSSSAWYATGVG